MIESKLEEPDPIAPVTPHGVDGGDGALLLLLKARPDPSPLQLRRRRFTGKNAQHRLCVPRADCGRRVGAGRDLRPAQLPRALAGAAAARTPAQAGCGRGGGSRSQPRRLGAGGLGGRRTCRPGIRGYERRQLRPRRRRSREFRSRRTDARRRSGWRRRSRFTPGLACRSVSRQAAFLQPDLGLASDRPDSSGPRPHARPEAGPDSRPSVLARARGLARARQLLVERSCGPRQPAGDRSLFEVHGSGGSRAGGAQLHPGTQRHAGQRQRQSPRAQQVEIGAVAGISRLGRWPRCNRST